MIPLLILASGVGTNGINVDLTSLIQYGVLGLVTILLILARLIPWSFYDEKKKEIERLNAELVKERANTDAVRTAKDAEIGALRSGLDERIIPLAIRLLDAVERGAYEPPSPRRRAG